MHATLLLLALAGSALAAPFSLPNGFPANVSSQTLAQISEQAGGTLPNGALPTKLSAGAAASLQLIAVNEIFEVAYFSSLLQNVTSGVQGYSNFTQDKDYVVASLQAIVAQEQLHAIGANAILKSAGKKTIPACNYKFPVTDFQSAIGLAQTFTDLVLGTLQAVQQGFALDGGEAASALVPLIGSIIAQEGEQNGAYRLLQRKTPSSAPFLTGSAGAFAFNAIGQNFIVNGSCDSVLSGFGIPLFKTLTLANATALQPVNQTIQVQTTFADVSTSNKLVYISGQNKPVAVSITNIRKGNGTATFSANLPFQAGANSFSKGLTIGALVKSGASGFSSPAAVANATVAGPLLLEIA